MLVAVRPPGCARARALRARCRRASSQRWRVCLRVPMDERRASVSSASSTRVIFFFERRRLCIEVTIFHFSRCARAETRARRLRNPQRACRVCLRRRRRQQNAHGASTYKTVDAARHAQRARARVSSRIVRVDRRSENTPPSARRSSLGGVEQAAREQASKREKLPSTHKRGERD